MYIYIYIYIYSYTYTYSNIHIYFYLEERMVGQEMFSSAADNHEVGFHRSISIYLSIYLLSLSLYIYTYSISIYLCIYIYLVESVVGQRLRWSSLERGGQPRGDVIREVGSMPGWRKWRLGALFTLSNLKTGMGLRDTLVSRMGGIRNIQ